MKKNIAVAAITFGMYIINCKVRTMVGVGVFGFFIRCYFNDIIGSITFMALTNIILFILGFREIVRPVYIEALLLGAGLFWEYVTPLFRRDTVSDPYDILAYLIGGVMYSLVIHIIHKIKNKTSNKQSF